MKKLLKAMGLFLAVVVMGIGFTGCQSSTTSKTYSIGFARYDSNPAYDDMLNGIIDGMKQEGIAKENLNIDEQSANLDASTAALIGDKFATEKVDLAFGCATAVAQAVFNALSPKNIPTVFVAVTSPVDAGLTEGNITGVSDKIKPDEQLALIRRILPDAKTIGIVYQTSAVNSQMAVDDIKAMADKYGFTIITKPAETISDISMALDSLLGNVDCILNPNDNLMMSSVSLVLEKTNAKKVPYFGFISDETKAGAIANVSANYYNVGVSAGIMGAKILKGEKASDIPFEYAKTDIYINSKAFEDLGITLPDDLKAEATDEADVATDAAQ